MQAQLTPNQTRDSRTNLAHQLNHFPTFYSPNQIQSKTKLLHDFLPKLLTTLLTKFTLPKSVFSKQNRQKNWPTFFQKYQKMISELKNQISNKVLNIQNCELDQIIKDSFSQKSKPEFPNPKFSKTNKLFTEIKFYKSFLFLICSESKITNTTLK